jgi:hypothetical protein
MINFKNILIITVFLAIACQLHAQLTDDQAFILFDKANQSFTQANESAADPVKAQALYETAILNYEKIIAEAEIENPKLYYNLANAYLLSNDIAKAILNYRRAEKLDSADANIQKNLAFARSQRIDTVTMQTQKRVLQTLFFWHYDFSLKTRFVTSCAAFAAVCLSLIAMLWFGRTPTANVTCVIAAILLVCCLTSVIVASAGTAKDISGVITAYEVVARQGDSVNYPPSFKEPLHAGTEFEVIESRPGWLHIRLFDSSDAWIPDTMADLI